MWGAPVVLLWAGVLVAVAALAPVVQLVLRAGSDGWDQALWIIVRPRTAHLLGNTVVLAGVVGLATLLLGIGVAYASTRVRLPAPRVWLLLACLPLAVPSFVGAFAWAAAFPGVTGLWPLALVMTLTCLPLVTVPTMGALALADHTLADVARTLGRRPVPAFVRVTLPQILPAALAGTLLVALYTISDFGAPAMLRYQTLTTGVYALFTGTVDRSSAAAMSLPLVLLALVCVWGEQGVRSRRAGTERSAAARRRPPRELSRPATTLVAAGLTLLAGLSVLGPLAALVIRMLRADRYAAAPVELVAAAVTSLALATVAATLTVLVALPVGYLAARYGGPVVRAIEAATMIGYALPGVVVALALVALTITALPFAYQGLAGLLAAYLVLTLPLAIGSARTAFARVPVPAREISRTLGHGPLATWLRVSVRTALPGIAAGWVLVAAEVLKELPATLMLRPIGVETLATELWTRTSIGAYGASAPIGLVLVLVGLIPALLLARSVGLRVAR